MLFYVKPVDAGHVAQCVRTGYAPNSVVTCYMFKDAVTSPTTHTDVPNGTKVDFVFLWRTSLFIFLCNPDRTATWPGEKKDAG